MSDDKQDLKDAIFELYCWKFSNTGCFSNLVFDLIAKADLGNKRLLAKAFPGYVAAYDAWFKNGTEWLKGQVRGGKK